MKSTLLIVTWAPIALFLFASFAPGDPPIPTATIAPGKVVRILGADLGSRPMLVRQRTGQWIALAPMAEDIHREAEVAIIAPIAAQFAMHGVITFEDWLAEAKVQRDEAQRALDRGNGFIKNGNGPTEDAKDLINFGTAKLQVLDQCESMLRETIASTSKAASDDYDAHPYWINLDRVAGFRIEN